MTQPHRGPRPATTHPDRYSNRPSTIPTHKNETDAKGNPVRVCVSCGKPFSLPAPWHLAALAQAFLCRKCAHAEKYRRESKDTVLSAAKAARESDRKAKAARLKYSKGRPAVAPEVVAA